METELEPPPAEAASRSVCSEDDIIDALSRSAPVRRALQVANGDDAVVFPDGTTVTVDLLCEGVHFDERLDPADLGYKAVAVSVSDLAAMGAVPERFVLTLSHPAPGVAWVDAFARGVAEAGERFEIDLVGGDTTRGAHITVGVTAIGRLVAKPMTRAGARPGHRLYATGWLGLAAAGYRLPQPPAEALAALRRPRPPVQFALELARSGLASAAMDLSDGPARDLPRMARSSGVRIVLDVASIPVHECLLGLDSARSLLLGGGDDYALLFTSPADPAGLIAMAARCGTSVAEIGRVESGAGAVCSDGPWPADAWSHFGEAS